MGGDAAERDIPPVPVGLLNVTRTGSVVQDLGSRTVHDLVVGFTAHLVSCFWYYTHSSAQSDDDDEAMPVSALARSKHMRRRSPKPCFTT